LDSAFSQYCFKADLEKVHFRNVAYIEKMQYYSAINLG